MRTKTITLYKFEELSDEAKKKAVSNFRDAGMVDTQHYWNEARKSVDEFHKIFPTHSGRNSWLDFGVNLDNDEMMGFRLQKFIWNNYGRFLFKGEYYSLWSKKDVSFEHYKDGFPVLKSRTSKIKIEGMNCVLTGVCYDDDLLKPIYDFLDARSGEEVCGMYFDGINIYDLFSECFHQLRKSLEDEDEYNESDEGITEHLNESELEFDEDGNIL